MKVEVLPGTRSIPPPLHRFLEPGELFEAPLAIFSESHQQWIRRKPGDLPSPGHPYDPTWDPLAAVPIAVAVTIPRRKTRPSTAKFRRIFFPMQDER